MCQFKQEYVKGISSTGMQSNHGFEGQVNACWTHKMTPKELNTIRSAGFPISVIHGRSVPSTIFCGSLQSWINFAQFFSIYCFVGMTLLHNYVMLRN